MLKQILLNGAFKFGTQLITLITTVLIARFMGASVVGEFNYAVSLIAIFKSFVINSLGSTNISLINKNQKDLHKSQNTLVLLAYISYSIYVLIILLYGYLNIFENNAKLFYIILILVFTELIGLYFTTSKSYFNATINQFKASFPEFIRVLTTKIIQIISVFIFSDILGLALSALISTIITLPVLFKYTPKISFQLPSKTYIKNYLKTALQFTTFTLNKLVPQQLDKIFLESTITFGFIGYYVIGQKVGNTIEIVAMSMGVILFPFFTKLGSEKDSKKAVELINKFLQLFFNGIAFLLFLVCFFSEDILMIVFGNDYNNSSISMIIYIILGIFSIMSIPFNNIALGFGDIKKVSFANIFSFIFFILAAIWITEINLDAQLVINLMSLARLLPYVFLLLFFVVYSKKLLSFNFLSSFLLIFIHSLLFILSYLSLVVLNFNKFLVMALFVFVYFFMNNLFGYSLKKTMKIIQLKLKK